MDPKEHFLTLHHNRDVFAGLLAPVLRDEIYWKPETGKWCLLEIVCHLADEEREDFRARVQHVLTQPLAPLPPIDPAGWVKSRHYIDQDYETVKNTFLQERELSVKWLYELENPVWDNAYQHPRFGPMTARLFLNNWVAHDLLHIRQIIRLRHSYLAAHGGTSLDYAGEW